jgi:hypothetical protein
VNRKFEDCLTPNSLLSAPRFFQIAMFVAAVLGGSARPVRAQDLEPRAYSASPIGTTFLVASAARSTGSVLTDPSLPFQDVDARLGIGVVGIGQTFNLLGRTALVLGAAPYARGHASGRIGDVPQAATRVGWADARVKLSVNLLGGAARSLREFAGAPRSPIIGVSLTAVLPTGQYAGNRLLNLGSNRWSFKPEAGLSVPVRRWTLDGYAGVWFFSANDEFYPGNAVREQDPVFALQGHTSYTIRPRLWAAFDATWYSGGTTTINGVKNADLQRNSRLGATLSLPLGARQSLKFSYSAGATTRIGGDFTTFGVAWQMTWIR